MTTYSWSDIADAYTDGLVLGNGASIAFDPRFSYTSLRERAEADGLITEDVQRVFDHLATVDFELVLRMLWHASMINEALEIPDTRTRQAYEDVRDALIAVVRAIHVPHEDVADRLLQAAVFMSRFKTVVSMNYDVLVYWAILAGNTADPLHRFKDCFVDGRFRDDWSDLREPISSTTSTTIVAYPHGNLAIGVDVLGSEFKIKADAGSALLETIIGRWESGSTAPVFVSEGTTEQKLSAIRRSPYLSTVYGQVLPDISESMVLFGWSVADNDLHLLDALCRGGARRIAVAVDPDSEDLDLQEARITQLVRERYRYTPPDIVLFDRASSGCWLSP